MIEEVKNNPYLIELLLSLIRFVIKGSYKIELTTNEKQNLVNEYQLNNIKSSYIVTVFTPSCENRYNLKQESLDDLVSIISSLGYSNWADFVQKENCEIAKSIPFQTKTNLDKSWTDKINIRIEQRINEIAGFSNNTEEISKIFNKLVSSYYSYWYSPYHNALVRNCSRIYKENQCYKLEYKTLSTCYSSKPINFENTTRILCIELFNHSEMVTFFSKLPTDCDNWEVISTVYSWVDPNDYQPYGSVEVFTQKNDNINELLPVRIEDEEHLKQYQNDKYYDELILMWNYFNLPENKPILPNVKLNTINKFKRYTNERLKDLKK